MLAKRLLELNGALSRALLVMRHVYIVCDPTDDGGALKPTE